MGMFETMPGESELRMVREMHGGLDLVIINPGAAHGIYGRLGAELTAVEPPLWARLIAGCVKDAKFTVRIIDAEAERKDPVQVALDIFAWRPRLVCIAVYGHQPSASTQQMWAASAIAKAIRQISPVKILMVGGHVAALPARTLKEETVDFVCRGEGPITVVELLRLDLRGQVEGLESVPDLVWWNAERGESITNEPAPLIYDLTKLHGDVWQLLPMELYRAHNWQCFDNLTVRQPYASVYTSLGCSFRCHFCCINAPFHSNRYRMRNPIDVTTEIINLYMDYKVRTFKIVDEMFVLNERHYVDICERLAAFNGSDDINIWAYARVDTIKPHTLQLMRRAGIKWLALGIESGSQYVRDGADKTFTNSDIFTVVREIQKAGINVIGNYIFGLPDDDMDSMRDTLNLALTLNTEFVNFYCAMAYPGSRLYDTAIKEGWNLPGSWKGYSQHNYECMPLDTHEVLAADVLKFRDEAFQIYFRNHAYLDMIGEKFGAAAVKHVNEMVNYPLPRKIVEERFAPPDKVSAQ